MKRSNQYEAAFEAYLQWHRYCYVAVDETRRAQLGGMSLKSLDFIVYGDGASRLLVDVKGRRFPSGGEGKQRKVWESWSTREDVEGLEHWTDLFGPGYVGLLVFAYQILPDIALPDDTDDLWTWRGRRYVFRAVTVADYHRHMRVRSPRWGTVGLPRRAFRELVRPLHDFTQGRLVPANECPF
jgi:hypothetical protein